MKKILIALIVIPFVFACKITKNGKSVKFEIDVTSDYCGGAVPSKEMIEKMRTPTPYTGVLYIHNRQEREDDGIKLTFDKGHATATGLAPGQYYAYIEKKIDSGNESEMNELASQGVDMGCLMEINFRMMFTFTVKESTKIIRDRVHKMCNPCLQPAP